MVEVQAAQGQQSRTQPLQAQSQDSGTAVARVEYAQRQDGSSYSRVIEVPVQKPAGFGFSEAVSAISAGSWAIVVLFGVLWWKFAPSVAKFLETYMSLLKTMKESLQENADSIKLLAESEKTQSITIDRLKATDQEILEVVRQFSKDIPALSKRMKVSVDVLEELRDLIESSVTPLKEIPETQFPKRIRAKLIKSLVEEEDHE